MPVTFLAIQRVLGYLVMLFSLTMLSPIPFSLYYGDGTWTAFAGSFLVILGSGAVIWYPVRDEERELRLRDGFLVVALFWVVLGCSAGVCVRGGASRAKAQVSCKDSFNYPTRPATSRGGAADLKADASAAGPPFAFCT